MAAVRLDVWDATGARRLADVESALAIECDGGARAMPSLIVDETRRQLGLDVAVLRVAAHDVVEVECLQAGTALDARGRWERRALSPAQPERMPWQRPGWLAATIRDVDRELARMGLRRTGRPVQARHTSVTGMLRIPTDAMCVWLKAVPPMFSHEATVIGWLARTAPPAVPTVLSDAGDWWLAAPFPLECEAAVGDPLVTLARLQIASAGGIDELLAAGCRECPLNRLASALARLGERDDLLDATGRGELREHLGALESLCDEVDALEFPRTIVHGDVSPMNVRWTAGGWFLYDWTDAYVGHPFADLASPLSYETGLDARTRAAAFAATWAEAMPASSVQRALSASAAIGAAHQVVNYAEIVDGIERSAHDQASSEQMMMLLRHWLAQLIATVQEVGR